MNSDANARISSFLDVILQSKDKDAQFRASTQMMKLIFAMQKDLFISIRDMVKDKKSLDSKEIEAIKASIESLISGVNTISSVYDSILSKEYKVN